MNAMTATQPTKAGVKKRKGKTKVAHANPAFPLVIATHGHEKRYERGDIAMDHKATEPDNPNSSISRARFMPQYAKLYPKTIDDLQRQAADKYAIEHERMGGARWVNGEIIGCSAAFWDRLPASEAQLRAVESIRGVEHALGERGTVLMKLFILENLPISALAERFTVNAHQMTGAIKAALTRAVEHWELEKDLCGPPSRIRSSRIG